jgi:hypothetical protein
VPDVAEIVGAVGPHAFPARERNEADLGDLGVAALAVYSRAVLEASMVRAFDDPNAHLAYAAVAVPSLLDLERRVALSPRSVSALAPPPAAPDHGIRLEGVSFRYAASSYRVASGRSWRSGAR